MTDRRAPLNSAAEYILVDTLKRPQARGRAVEALQAWRDAGSPDGWRFQVFGRPEVGYISVLAMRFLAQRAARVKAEAGGKPCELGHPCSMICWQVNECPLEKCGENTKYWGHNSETPIRP